jgi:hypothetical protein
MPITTPIALPNLHFFRFQGVGMYLEALVHRPSGKIYFDNLGNLAVASGNYREIIIIARFLTPHNLAIIYLRLSR